MLKFMLLSIVRPGEGEIKVATRGRKERNARRTTGTCNILRVLLKLDEGVCKMVYFVFVFSS